MNDQSTDGTEQTQVGHCKADEMDEYVGRGPGGRDMLSAEEPGQHGWLGNPFTVKTYGREGSIKRFRTVFVDKLERDEEFREAVSDLSGKVLGCWCQRLEDDEPACHAEVISKYADRLNQPRQPETDHQEGSDE